MMNFAYDKQTAKKSEILNTQFYIVSLSIQ